MTRKQDDKVLKKSLDVAGISGHGKFSSHSLRIGASTWFY